MNFYLYTGKYFCRYDGLFGIPLQRLVAREGRETPLVLSRLLQEIEHRDVDYSGLYIRMLAILKLQNLGISKKEILFIQLLVHSTHNIVEYIKNF